MARLQTARTMSGDCIERLVQDDYDQFGNGITRVLTSWSPCNTDGKWWGRVAGNITGTGKTKQKAQQAQQFTRSTPVQLDTETINETLVEAVALQDQEKKSGCGCSAPDDCNCTRRKIMIIGAVALLIIGLLALNKFRKSK